jgi:TolB-like protein
VSGPRATQLAVGSVLALALAGRSLPAQGHPVVIALLPFGDRGSFGQDKEVFRALRLGIPATIAAELSNHPELRLADPSRLKQALQAQHADPAARLDAATAAQIGKQVGARYAITGNFADFYGKFRLDARIVDVESGQIVKVVSNSDLGPQDWSDLYRIVQRVGHKVLAEASPAAGGEPRENEGTAIPTEALTEFSLGLLAETEGDSAKASRYYTQALATFPNYAEAREGLRRVRGS